MGSEGEGETIELLCREVADVLKERRFFNATGASVAQISRTVSSREVNGRALLVSCNLETPRYAGVFAKFVR